MSNRPRIEQFWFGTSHLKLFGVLRSTLTSGDEAPPGVVFFTGFGQSKAGFHFMFTRIAQRLAPLMPTLQFDYRGWGESEGETTECTLSSLIEDAHMAKRVLQERFGCHRYILIGAGFGNWIAAYAGLSSPGSALVLLAPYRSPLPLRQIVGARHAANLTARLAIVDTAQLGSWSSRSPLSRFFLALGASRSYSKGILLRWQLLTELANIDAASLLRDYSGPAIEFHPSTELPLALIPHQSTLELPEGTLHLSHPLNQDFINDHIFSWVQDLQREIKFSSREGGPR